MNSGTKEQAAGAFLTGFEKPGAIYRNARLAKYNRGVPSLDHYMGGSSTANVGGGAKAGYEEAMRMDFIPPSIKRNTLGSMPEI